MRQLLLDFIESDPFDMHSSLLRFVGKCLLIAACLVGPEKVQAGDRPNILVIVADDLGYADVGFQGCKDISTPHLDSLAADGVKCTNGFVSHPFCSPTRAGLLTGRYQHRFGHENNPKWLPDSLVDGLPLSQTTIADVMRTAGYETGCVGKWHLGAHPQFHPNRRGFDHYFGALGGGHVYLEGLKGSGEYVIPMDRNGTPEPMQGYITTQFGQEASKFIEKKREQPWLLYLAFNAPHTPLQSTPELQKRVEHIANVERRNLAALIVGLDDAIGNVISKLKSTGQYDNTLVFFFSDNGGPITVSRCDNTPLRAGKGSLYEGGMRVPFLVSWPKKLPRGKTYEEPVISLDVFSTAVAVGNAKTSSTHQPEGTNLIPHLTAEIADAPHQRLFWRTGGGISWAVREGRWKLVGKKGEKPELYDLAKDIGETNDIAANQSEVAERLQAAYSVWDQDNVTPVFESPRAAKPKANTK